MARQGGLVALLLLPGPRGRVAVGVTIAVVVGLFQVLLPGGLELMKVSGFMEVSWLMEVSGLMKFTGLTRLILVETRRRGAVGDRWWRGQRTIRASVWAADRRGAGVMGNDRQGRKTASLLRNDNRRRQVATIQGAVHDAVDGGGHDATSPQARRGKPWLCATRDRPLCERVVAAVGLPRTLTVRLGWSRAGEDEGRW